MRILLAGAAGPGLLHALTAGLTAVVAFGACSGSDAPADADSADTGSAETFAGDTPVADTPDATVADTASDLPPKAGDGGIDPGLVQPKDGCAPACKAKVCGPDGCGGVCGFCKTGQVCEPDGSACKVACVPVCKGKQCGANGCGGDCGACGDGLHCGDDFLCHPDDCVPKCDGKQCGDNGCGKACGVCGLGDLCDPGGQCKPGPCKGIPKEGKCSGAVLIACEGQGQDEQKTQVDCAVQPGKTCGFDETAGKYDCIQKPPCEPSCKGENGLDYECGDDGCGGPCGKCTDGWACAKNSCVPKAGAPCGTLAPVGMCNGDKWLFCNQGKVAEIDCGEAGMQCKWNGKKYGCE